MDEPGGPTQSATFSKGSRMLRIGAVAGILGGLVAAFGYAGGWVTPSRLGGERFVNTFEQVNGVHAGFRRNHAKGLGFQGVFESTGTGEALSSAAVFRPGRTPVVGRFSLAGGMPYQVDAEQTVRSMALRLVAKGARGGEWRTGMINLPVFPMSTPATFLEQLEAGVPDAKTGKPDPTKMTAFLTRHPESARAIGIIKAALPTEGFHDSVYRGLNAFWFVNAEGKKTAVRWRMEPMAPATSSAQPGSTTAAVDRKNYLFDDLIARIHAGPLRWRMVVTIGEAGDATNDASIAWPAGRREVEVGVLTVERVEAEAESEARDINFDPLVLPEGIEASDDPLLSARSAAYSQSFTRRAGERKVQSAVTPEEVSR